MDAGADVNARDGRENPLLYAAVDEGEADIVRTLLNAGADVNAKNRSGTSPLKLAFDEEESEIFRILVNAGAEIDFPPPVPRGVRVVDRTDSSLAIEIELTVYGGIETHYVVRRRNATESGEWVDLEVRDTSGRFEDQGLNADSTYYYALRACNEVGCSELSSETAGVTEASGQVNAPAAPLLSAGTSTISLLFVWNTYIDLSWNAVGGATYYEVYRRDSLVSQLSAPSGSRGVPPTTSLPIGSRRATRPGVRHSRTQLQVGKHPRGLPPAPFLFPFERGRDCKVRLATVVPGMVGNCSVAEEYASCTDAKSFLP